MLFLSEEDVSSSEFEDGDFVQSEHVIVCVSFVVCGFECGPLFVGDRPSPCGCLRNDCLVESVLFVAVDDVVSVLVKSVDGDLGVGGGEGGDRLLELTKVEVSVAVSVDHIPVLVSEIVQVVLAALGHADKVGHLGAASGQLCTGHGIVGASAKSKEWLKMFVVNRVDAGGEVCVVVGGEVVDGLRVLPPVLHHPFGGRGGGGGNQGKKL